MTIRRHLLFGAVAIAFMALGAGVGLLTARHNAPADAPPVEGLLWPNPKQIGPFSAIDQDGNAFDLARLQNTWSLLFFGYTHCPDVCPITLAVLKQVRGAVQARGGALPQTVFVTVDPARDDPARLREYVRYFDPAFIGVGGSDAQIQSLTRQLGIVSMTHEPAADGAYLVDHSASVFLIDPQARLVAVFSAPHDAADIAERLAAIRAFIPDGRRG